MKPAIVRKKPRMRPADVRKKLGLTPPDMAKLLGVHYMTWHKWESEARQPNTATISYMETLVWLKANGKSQFDALLDMRVNQDKCA